MQMNSDKFYSQASVEDQPIPAVSAAEQPFPSAPASKAGVPAARRFSSKSSSITVRELAELAVITALMIALKEAMNALPNIHPVMLLLILSVRRYGRRALYPALGFSLVECLLYGFGMWSVSYLYIWPLSVLLALPFRRNDSPLFWACFAGVFGLCFGALSALTTLFLFGWHSAVAYWVSGIPFDLIHCVSNFILVLILYNPLTRVMNQIS